MPMRSRVIHDAGRVALGRISGEYTTTRGMAHLPSANLGAGAKMGEDRELPDQSGVDAGHGPVRAQPPAAHTGIRLSRPPDAAGGPKAVVSAMSHTLSEMGPVRGLRVLGRINQQDGFDCPGCAWPDPAGERAMAEFCENGAKAVAEEATSARVTPDFFAKWSVEELSRQSDHWLGKQGRLTHPVVLRPSATHYEPIEWDEAFGMIATALRDLETPDEALFYTSGRTSNEAAFLYQLFVRQFGTNNLPDCSNMCHESSGVGLGETIGIGKGTVTLEDFDHAELIVVIGQNPGTNHPRMLTALERAVKRGCRIVSINPLPEVGLARFKQPQDLKNPLRAAEQIAGPGTRIAELHLPVRINGDVALLKGVMKELLEEEARRPGEVLDGDFIANRTTGFEALASELERVEWEDVERESGIERAAIQKLAAMVMSSERMIVTWAMGLTQHRNAVSNIQEIVNLVLMRGSIGKPGAGLCPVRGHSNVQGDRTMGIWERPPEAFLDALEREFSFSPPREHGLDTVGAIEAMCAGRAHVFFAMGGNFLSATPDTEATAAGLRRCRLTAHVSTKLNRSHLVTGEVGLILPCLARTESDVRDGEPQFVSVENSMGVVHRSQGRLKPASAQLLSEPKIVARLARVTLGTATTVEWEWLVEDYDRIRDAIERVIPGFEDYNLRVRGQDGFYLPNAPREGRFDLPGGRAVFTVHPMPKQTLAPGELIMMTIRSHDQFNTTIYGLDDRYRGVHNERRVIFMHPDDISDAGLGAGRLVDIFSEFENVIRAARGFLVVPFEIPRRCAATYFPEANVLVPLGSVAEKSNTPASKSVVIRVVAAG
jgi:molybdopterin-dependent oxidoreductase alpha subunit